MSDKQGYDALADAVEGEDRPGEVPPQRSRRQQAGALAQRLRMPLLVGVPVLAVALGLFLYLTGGRYVSTDDAYVKSANVEISSNVPGRVSQVFVRDNQRVTARQPLFRLDSRPFDTAAEEASAQLATSRLVVEGQRATLTQRQVEAAAANATLAYEDRELARQKTLAAGGVSSQAQLEAQSHAVDVARANLAAAKAAVANARAALGAATGGWVGASPEVQRARAALDRAQLNQSYGAINAPQGGTVTRVDQLQVGTYVNAAQPVFTLVTDKVWVEANFKEDQLAHMRVGQAATLQIDALPGHTLKGHVDSLSPGAGSAFALLPAENATGNWVKVVQRLPVRIALDDPPADLALRAGLSVKVKVDTRFNRLGGPKGPR